MSQRSSRRPTSLFRQIYELPYNDSHKLRLYRSAKGSPSMVQRLSILKKLPIHNGCVNCICWSQNGEYLLSGSDDHHLVVTNATKDFKTEVRYQTNHRANIFNARFLPNRSYTNVISCSGDGLITFSDLSYPIPPSYLPSDTNSFSCHTGTVYELTTIPQDPNTFLSAGEDYTVRCFDLRVKSKCHKIFCKDDILIQCQRAVTTISINEMAPYQMAIGTSDSTVRIFDRRMLGTISAGFTATNTSPVVVFTAPGLDNRPYRITSVAFSPDGQDVLASYSSEYLYLFNLGAPASPPRSYDTMGYAGEGEGGGGSAGGGDDVKACPVRRLRLRGDWSDTGPDARPEREAAESQTRPTVHSTVMQRMTDLLTRILNDPMTRAAITGADREMEPGPITSDETDSESSSNHGHDEDRAALQTLQRETTSTDFVHSMDSNPQPSMDTDTTSTTARNRQTIHQQPGPSMDTANMSEPSANSNPCLRTNTNPIEPSTSIMESEPITPQPIEPTPTLSHPSTSSNPISCSDNTESNVNNSRNVEKLATSHSTIPSTSDDIHMLPSTSPLVSVPSESDNQPTTSFHAVPSTSATAAGDDVSTGMMGFSTFKDQIQDMREGYVKRHGKEPALVSLKVNNTGTMASSISFKPETSATGGPMEPGSSSGINNTLETSRSSPVRQRISETSSMSGDDIGHEPIDDEMDIDQSSGDEQTTRPQFISSVTVQPSQNYILTTEEPPDSYATGSGMGGTSSGSSGGKRKQRGSGFNDEGAVRGIMKQKFTGHRNARTMIKQARFWGDSYVMSGSDCGHVFIWDRHTGALAMCLEGDKHVVNCVSAHPTLPLLATSGIDYDVKIWEPRLEEPGFDLAKAEELIKRNEIMLEETKDTITVPASFMIRMLACLNQIRRGGLNRNRRGGSESAAE
uniref:DDB1- and CUL4-associated factor 6 n=1 Tax=Cacopsylla melanoneura TaxID=428564 RepID=A0A8D9FGF8_9HEMI